MSLSRAQNIFMPANIDYSFVLLHYFIALYSGLLVSLTTNPLPGFNRTNAFTHEAAQLRIPVTHRVLWLENHLNFKQQQNIALS